MSFDLSQLGAWGSLPFFTDHLPRITDALDADPRPVYPPQDQVFSALARTQPDDVKVVIFGQDPYPQPGKAHGFAFSIPDDFPPRRHRDSLDNIFEELQSDLGVTRSGSNLEDWADKGVLLFNCLALTVPQDTAGGHRSLGWKTLTAQVLDRLQDRPRAYLLWGGDAHKAGRDVGTQTNLVIKSSHPSPMGVHKTGTDYIAFRGARPFSRTNAWLRTQGLQPINWGDPETHS
ncbi:MAG: uracil-DNA glycosylase [Sulfitobacter sp.]